MANVRKFVFFDPTTGQYKEQTSNDTIQVANGVDALDAVNVSQLDAAAAAAAAAVAAEEARALAAEAALQSAIDGVAADLATETARATAAEGVLTADLAAEVTAREAAITALNTALSADILAEQTRAQAAEAELAQDILDEQTRAEGVEADLQSQITAEVAARESAITNLNSTLSAAISAEEAARIAADGVLQTNIDDEEAARIAADSALQTALDAEIARATAAEGVLTADLATEVAAREAAVTAEASARQLADEALEADLAAEISRATGAETTLQANIDAEAAARAAAITAEETARIAGDAATLASANAYTDAVAQGLSVKQAVRFALPTSFEMGGNTINLPADFNSIAGNLTDVGAGDRILLIQPDGSAGAVAAGIYVVAGSAGSFSLARAPDMAVGSDASGAFIYVEEGVMGSSIPAEAAGTGMVCANIKGNDIVGTAALTFSVFSRAEALNFIGGVEKNGLDVSLKFAPNAPFTQDSGLALEMDGDYFNADAGILTMQGVLVDGPMNIADAKHGHSRMSKVRAATTASEAHFANYAGGSATWDSSSCFAFVESKDGSNNALVVLGGVGSHSALSDALSAFSVGDVVYIGAAGGEFSDFASVPSGKWAIPVGKKEAADALNVSIGVPLLKA
jgi:hypothetical protein